MRRTILIAVLLLASFAIDPGYAQEVPAPQPVQNTAQTPPSNPTPQAAAYSLSPEKLQKAIAYSHDRILLSIAGILWSIIEIWLLLALGIVAWMRDFAVFETRSRWLQCIKFLFLLLFATTVLDLPLAIIRHHLGLAYGQSVQGWLSWFSDIGKEFFVEFVVGTLLTMLLFWVIRKSPQRWWFWFSLVLIPLIVFGTYLVPIVIDPIFNRFEPLQSSNPALVKELEKVTSRTGVSIPPERFFLMRATEKTTAINAYVTGFGPSKRFVMWDTAINQLTPGELLFVFGHETGHYVLHHIVQGVIFTAVSLFVLFYLGFRILQWLIARKGSKWGVPAQYDWAALAVLVFVLNLLSLISMPIENGFSRHIEHQADVYGQEAIHGLVPNPKATAVAAFQRLGEAALEEPDPNPVVEFWLSNHPSVSHRAAFAQQYDPWAAGQQPKYFPK